MYELQLYQTEHLLAKLHSSNLLNAIFCQALYLLLLLINCVKINFWRSYLPTDLHTNTVISDHFACLARWLWNSWLGLLNEHVPASCSMCTSSGAFSKSLQNSDRGSPAVAPIAKKYNFFQFSTPKTFLLISFNENSEVNESNNPKVYVMCEMCT